MLAIFVTAANGLSYGLLLFLLSAGLSVTYGMLGVLNFAHGAFYMLGAYLGWSLASRFGLAAALLGAPLCCGLLGALLERCLLRPLRTAGREAPDNAHARELLTTFAVSLLIAESLRLVYGDLPLTLALPGWLDGSLPGLPLSRYRLFVVALAGGVLVALWLGLRRTRLGLLLRAARSDAQYVEALGHAVPSLQTAVFGAGTGLAGLAGVLGGAAFTVEPGMATSIGSLVFVIVALGGPGALFGPLLASLTIGLGQSALVASGMHVGASGFALARLAPLLPYGLLLAALLWRRDTAGRRA